MLTNKEFNDAFTSVGGKFFANTYNYLADNTDLETWELVDKLFSLGYDSNKSGTRTRISSAKRLIKDNRGIRALKKIACSNMIQKDAVKLARQILKERFSITHYDDLFEKTTHEKDLVLSTMNVIKLFIQAEVDNIKDSLITASDKIHDNPELGYEEFKAVEILTGELDKHGFVIEKCLNGIPTAFKATFIGKENGPVIAFLAEYDALPGIGHACGHNMIGTMSVGAAIALSKVMKDIPGEIVVFGTPAEETSGAKVTMVNEGVFDNVDVAMMIHPKDSNSIIESNLAIDAIEFAYKGKVAQAAIAPWDGINALDGVIQLFVAVNALRLRLRPEIRVHGIITKGGLAANIIPDEAVARFYIRGPKRKDLDKVVKTINECAEGAAKSTQTTVTISNYEFSFENMVPNVTMANAFRDNLIDLGVKDINEEPITSFGSSDMGNVSHIIPAIHPYLAIAPKGTITHSIEFTEATASERAHEVLIIGAKALAMTGYDILTNKQLYNRIKEEFRNKN